MLPLYVLIVLAGVGYYVTKEPQTQSGSASGSGSSASIGTVSRSDMPSMNDVYDSNYSYDVSAELGRINKRAYDRSENPQKTGVISKNYRMNAAPPAKNVESRLAGVEIPGDDFTHNNMVPFFGGSIRQNMRGDSTQSIMESQSGTFSLLRPKREVEAFGDQVEDAGNVFGSTGAYQQMQTRIEGGRARNNETPFDKVYVGPGIGQGYGSAPTGGYQQLDLQEKVLPKTADDLRVATKPKNTYAGRVTDGIKHSLPGEIGEVAKRRVDTYYENDEERYFTTTGAYVKDAERPEQLLRYQERAHTSREYGGNAHANIASEARPDVKESSRKNLADTGILNPVLDDRGAGHKFDHGKASILVYANERDITACRTYEGNIASAVRAVIAPLEDLARSTIKEYTIANARPNGQFNAQIPSKLTIYDPNDVARTTIKETLIHDPHTGLLTGPRQSTVYDPDAIARTTTRQTLPDQENSQNLRGHSKSKVYDPEDKARTTTKETTINNDRDGNIDRAALQDGGGYETSIYDVKVTQRQFTADNDYSGQAYNNRGEGYDKAVYDMKATQKQFTTDNDYYGTAGSAFVEKQTSYGDMYNANINTTKELVMASRAPTQTGVKVAPSADDVNIDVRKVNVFGDRTMGNRNHVINEIPSKRRFDGTVTTDKPLYAEDNRIDPSLLTPFMKNPYTQSLSSAS